MELARTRREAAEGKIPGAMPSIGSGGTRSRLTCIHPTLNLRKRMFTDTEQSKRKIKSALWRAPPTAATADAQSRPNRTDARPSFWRDAPALAYGWDSRSNPELRKPSPRPNL